MPRKTWPDGHPYEGGHYIYRGTRNAIYIRDRCRCVYCRADAFTIERERGGFTLDHVKPVVSEGRRHEPANLVTSCRECNIRKGSGRVTTVFGKAAADRVRRATRREMPPKIEGRRFHEARVAARSRVPWAAARGWLDPASFAALAPELPIDVEGTTPHDDDIPF